MNNTKLVVLASTICTVILLLIFIIGINPRLTHAYNSTDIPVNVTEILFNTNSDEIKRVYDLNLVNVIINGRPYKVLTNRTDIHRLLRDMGVVVDNSKKIITTNDEIINGTTIRVITVGTVIEEENIDIPFKTEKINTKDIAYGETEVSQKGVLGVRTKQVRKVYEDGKLISEEVLSEEVTKEPVNEVIKVGVLSYGIQDLEKTYGYNCKHWYKVVDNGNYTDQEKQWLKFVMECESGCNAESDKNPTYKGLFQWHPYYWNVFYPNDNIYDGYAQIENTIKKIRGGVKLHIYWPSCHAAYVREFGEYVK
jgi:hypothetical protein